MQMNSIKDMESIRGHFYISVWITFCLFLFSSCCKEPPPVEPEMQRSVLIYMAAHNSLGRDRDDYANIEKLKQGFLPANGNIIIYHDAYDAPPRMFRLVKGANNLIEEELIAEYSEEDSADPSVLTRSLLLMRDLFPADDYGLIFWSHGLGWLPAVEWNKYRMPVNKYEDYARMGTFYQEQQMPRTKDCGQDTGAGSWMNIHDMADAIPFHLSFLIFDACLMGTIEVAFPFREKVDYMIASPTEIISEGFPYHQIMEPLFLPTPDYNRVCNAFFYYYDEHPYGGYWQSATIALYQLNELSAFAGLVGSIIENNRLKLNDFVPSVQSLQCYDRIDPDLFFDLGDFISNMATPSEYVDFVSSLNRLVPYKRATEKFFYVPIDSQKFNGIATYVPNGSKEISSTREAYKLTEWNHAVGLVE